MAVNVITIRGAADNPGPDIIDALCTTEIVAVSRGTQYIDANNKSRVMVSTNGPSRGWVSPADLAEVIDSEVPSYRALIAAVSISLIKDAETFTADTSFTLEKIYV